MAEASSKSSSLRLIGYWIESLRDHRYLAPQEFVRPLADEVRKAVVEYLSHGEVYETYRGASWCRFFCGHEMGCREFSDGHWVWPEDLAHYVRDHGVTLPGEFLDHVRAGIPRIPRSRWESQIVDTRFWKEWCRRNSLGNYAGRIAQARLRADQVAAVRLNESIAAIEAKEGVSNERCQSQGCGNFALNGRVLCARCCRRENESAIVEPAYRELRSVLVG